MSPISGGVINTFLEEPTEDSLLGLFTRIGMSRDPRAKRNMVPDEVWNSIPPDPEIIALEKQRHELKNGEYRIRGRECELQVRELTKEIRRRRTQREKEVEEKYRELYFYNRLTWDIKN
ncbi:hypothetical protein F4782DRAFT_545714 [Xylaria castorea]|nr:hypothetical protein F4782DRAFT_545714 [Xylaria castorea]